MSKKIKDGPVKKYHENGKVLYEGHLKDNKLDGPFKSYHKSGQISEIGLYKNGELHGQWKSFDDNGNLSLNSNYIDGNREGVCTSYVDGQLRDKSFFKDGKLKYTEEYRNGRHYETVHFKDDGEISWVDKQKEKKKTIPLKKNKKSGIFQDPWILQFVVLTFGLLTFLGTGGDVIFTLSITFVITIFLIFSGY